MAFAPLILTGNQKINGVDVSDQVISFRVVGARAQTNIPATYGERASFAGGDDTYTVEIEYLSDTDATALTQIFWTAIAATPGTITFEGSMRSGAVSASNPAWTGTALVTAVGIGGTVKGVGRESVTFPCLDRPTQITSPSS